MRTDRLRIIGMENQIMKLSSRISAAVLMLAGCASSPDATGFAANYSSQSTPSLWHVQETTKSPLDLALVEAELGARGVTTSGYAYLGARTASAYGRSLYSRTGSPQLSGKACSDFQSTAAAQRFFLANGGPVSDPYNLDGDGDGLACEWGKTIKRVASTYRPKSTTFYTPSYRSTSSSYCHVGPRGGTYTITASGAKNYDGC